MHKYGIWHPLHDMSAEKLWNLKKNALQMHRPLFYFTGAMEIIDETVPLLLGQLWSLQNNHVYILTHAEIIHSSTESEA